MIIAAVLAAVLMVTVIVLLLNQAQAPVPGTVPTSQAPVPGTVPTSQAPVGFVTPGIAPLQTPSVGSEGPSSTGQDIVLPYTFYIENSTGSFGPLRIIRDDWSRIDSYLPNVMSLSTLNRDYPLYNAFIIPNSSGPDFIFIITAVGSNYFYGSITNTPFSGTKYTFTPLKLVIITSVPGP